MSIAPRIEKFRDAMKGHEGCYVLIGGSACSILFSEVGQRFRATKDLDIVLLVGQDDSLFAKTFWEFIKHGGYEIGKNSEGKYTYYRFKLPKQKLSTSEYPAEIELFARHADFHTALGKTWITPLPFDEAISSLSAIILDDGYYEFIRAYATPIHGITTLSALHIIPLKMRAHIDNRRLHDEGEKIQGESLTKHSHDIINLTRLLSENSKLILEGQLLRDAQEYLFLLQEEINSETHIKRKRTLLDAQNTLHATYLSE